MEKVRFGVVGTNFISDWVMAGARQDKRFEATAVCSRSSEKALAFAQRHGIRHTFVSLEEMLQNAPIDAVYIATPNYTHAQQSILCMAYGKHVLCEKPMASNAAEVRQMVSASAQYNVALMEAMKPTLTPNFTSLRKHLHRVGKVRRYFSCYCQYSSRYDRYKAGELPNAFNPEYANGAAMDIGVYTIYPMVVLFGRPQTVTATGIVLPSGADGQGAVSFTYPDMDATILYSKIADSALPTEIQGEQGRIMLDKINTIGNVWFASRLAATSGKGPEPPLENISHKAEHDEYYYEIQEFINVVQAGRRQSEINSHEHSLITIDIIDQIRRQLGVTYPADREKLS